MERVQTFAIREPVLADHAHSTAVLKEPDVICSSSKARKNKRKQEKKRVRTREIERLQRRVAIGSKLTADVQEELSLGKISKGRP